MRITIQYANGDFISTTMYSSLKEYLDKEEFKRQWKLKQPVDKRTRFYKYLVDQGIVKNGETIYNRDIQHIA